MSFDEQWAQLEAAAAKDRSAGMQLAGYGPDAHGRGSKPKLKVTPSVLREKATKTDENAGDFMKADNKTMTETGQVKASLKGFKSAAAFDVFEDRWKAQMKHLQGSMKEGVAGALRSAAANFEASDKFPLEDGGKGKDGGDDRVPR
ncbi:hypothetical protein DVA86_24860 [Streptomyces armeniacus]|uniref:WXG100 family type VII secretion target n=1 Tax=Streptomyces armeniacus TaxID=83291 RepID=A0A345XUT1_9ACTN|nr:type VII secretion target [Streptomyces armeniacus]AXK35397.1 hypothetical protein DVA86_24860 [Streptomyces armeniacus]